jgi:AcrR family transcriptional regulator
MSRATDIANRPGPRRRLPSEERRAQIVEAALRLVAKHGVQGTTLHRIAEELGITHPALYAHFSNRREILLAALDVLFARIMEVHRASSDDNALERLRAISLRHTALVASAPAGFVFPLFEFLAASPEEGLRDELAVRQRALARDLADIVREGQAQRTIRPDVDAEQVGWLITSRHWTEDVALLMGVTEDWDRASSMRLLDLIISSIEMPPGGEGAGAQPGGAPPRPTAASPGSAAPAAG